MTRWLRSHARQDKIMAKEEEEKDEIEQEERKKKKKVLLFVYFMSLRSFRFELMCWHSSEAIINQFSIWISTVMQEELQKQRKKNKIALNNKNTTTKKTEKSLKYKQKQIE